MTTIGKGLGSLATMSIMAETQANDAAKHALKVRDLMWHARLPEARAWRMLTLDAFNKATNGNGAPARKFLNELCEEFASVITGEVGAHQLPDLLDEAGRRMGEAYGV